jgi:2-methylcitrate dehydratase
MRKGFDHTTLLAYGAAAGVARALGLDKDRATHAVAISGDSALALTVTRAHPTSNWKGLAAPQATMTAVHTTFLAMRGITGPPEVFEGPKGFFEATGTKADIDWSDSTFNIATRTTLKPHNAEVHTQSTITAVLALRRELGLRAADVDRVKVEVFKVAYDITGGGAWGPRDDVHVKEEADHSLPYLVAVALLDGQVLPEQFAPKRINSPDVQELLKRVTVTDRWLFTRRYPKKVPSRVTVTLNDGRSVAIEADEFEGFHTAPMAWDRVVEKFEGLSAAATTAALRRRVIDAVADLEHVPAGELARLLGQARPGAGKARPRGRAGQRRAGSVRDGKTALPARR